MIYIGLQDVSAVLQAGTSAMLTLDGQPVTVGARREAAPGVAWRGAQPVLNVEWHDGHWQPLKLN